MSWGVGREPCAAFIDNSDEADNRPAAMSDMYAALQWAEGYITAHNREGPGVYHAEMDRLTGHAPVAL